MELVEEAVMQRCEAQEMADDIARAHDERLDEMVRCQHCDGFIPIWWFEESVNCPECGERVMG